jgi:hypothetical protein
MHREDPESRLFQRRMTPPIRGHLGACAVVAMMCSIVAVHGKTIQLNWTSDGVRDYTRYVLLSSAKCIVAFCHALTLVAYM